MDLADRIQLWVSYVIRASLLVAVAAAAWNEQWQNLFLITLIFFLTFFPALIERNYKVSLPIEFEVPVIFFIYATLYLGEIREYYFRFWWWDVFLHAFSSLILGFVGFLIVYILNSEKKLQIKMAANFVAFFSFVFALAIGAIWEIFEFFMDSNFGLNMQKSGLVDTMWDLIIDGLGAALAAFFGYLYLKRREKKKSFVFDRLIRKFIKENPKLFVRKKKKFVVQK